MQFYTFPYSKFQEDKSHLENFITWKQYLKSQKKKVGSEDRMH